MKVKECMCSNVACIKPETLVSDCAKLMCDKHIGCVPVCDNQNKIVGIITDRDIMLRTIACGKEVGQTPASEIMTCNVNCCNPETEVEEAEKIMSKEQIRRIPVIDNNKVVGILTLANLTNNKNVSTESVCATLENICSNNAKNAE